MSPAETGAPRHSSRPGLKRSRENIRQLSLHLLQPETLGEQNVFDWSSFGHVAIAPSGAIPGVDTGRGLFATSDFDKDAVITEYSGVVMLSGAGMEKDQTHDASVVSVNGKDPLVLRGFREAKEFKTFTHQDKDILVNVGQIANDARNRRGTNSVRLSIERSCLPPRIQRYKSNKNLRGRKILRLFMVATKHIKTGDEIFTSYHAVYWKQFHSFSRCLTACDP